MMLQAPIIYPWGTVQFCDNSRETAWVCNLMGLEVIRSIRF